MKINYCLNLFILIIVPSITNQADFKKIIYQSQPELINSIACVSFSFFFKSNGIKDNGELLVSLAELDEDGVESGWVTIVKRISLKPELADDWIDRSTTIHFDHAALYIVSVLHEMPKDDQSTTVLVNVTLDKNYCQNKPHPDESTSKVDRSSTQSFDISTTKGVPIVTQSPVITSTLNYDDETKLVKQSDAITIDSAYDDQKTRLDASVTPTSPVTTENSYTTIEVPTIVTQSSTTIDSIVTMSSTVNHENHSTQSETTTIDTNSQYVDQMSTKSTTNESTDSTKSTTNESTDSTKSTTTIKIVLIDAIQPEPTASDSNNEPDAKTGSIEDDLIFKIKFLTNKRNAIASVTGLVGLFIMMASLTFLISRLKRQNYQPRNRDLIVSSSSNGIALHTITINRQSTA